MPDIAVHYYFGQEVLSSLPAIYRIDPGPFQFALTGPDDWFFYLTDIKKTRRAPQMHNSRTGEFLRALAEEESLFSYFAGFVCHYVLDSACHPFINAMTGIYEKTAETKPYRGNHMAFEKALDRWIMNEKQADLPVNRLLAQKPLPKELATAINRVYQNVFGWTNAFRDLNISKAEYRKCMWFIKDQHGILKFLTGLVPNPMVLALPNSRLYYQETDILNTNHNAWHHPNDPDLISTASFPELMEEAKRSAIQIITCAYNGDLSAIGNRSYITGFDLDDPRNHAAKSFQPLARQHRGGTNK